MRRPSWRAVTVALTLAALTSAGADFRNYRRAPRGGGPSGPTAEAAGAVVFDLLSTATPETTECACADLTATTGGAVTTTRNSVGACEKADGSLVFCAVNKPRVQLVGGVLSLVSEVSTINSAKQSSDLSVALNWAVTSMTCAKDATGPTGVANSVSTCTSTGADGTVLQTFVNSSANRSTCARIKRLTGTGVVEMTPDNGSTWVDVTSAINGSTFTLLGPHTHSALNGTTTNPVFGIRLRTSGDAVAVGYFKTVQSMGCGSDIETTTAAVTRSADVVTAANPLTPSNSSSWCFAATATPIPQAGGANWTIATNKGVIALGAYNAANTATILIPSNGRFTTTLMDAASGTRSYALNPPSPLAVGTHTLVHGNRSGAAVATTTNYLDGSPVTPAGSGAGTGAITTQGATLYLGTNPSNGQFQGYLSNFKVGNGPTACL